MFALIPIFTLFLLVSADNWATYPKIPKTASINGFADPIIDILPECAKECVKISTKNTPCPYWDTGCFCVMPQWAGSMGKCVAESCKGSDVASARYLATSLCNAVGASTVIMPASISEALASAAGDAKEVTTIEGKTAKSWVISSGDASKTGDSSVTSTDSKITSSDSKTSTTLESQTSSETTANLGYKTSGLASILLLVVLSFFI